MAWCKVHHYYVSGTSTWTHDFTQSFNAPSLAFGNITISDPSGNNNGRLDPGETVSITMPISNSGAATSPTGSATLSCSTTGITINTGTANFAAIAAGGSTNLSFSLSAASSVSIETVATLSLPPLPIIHRKQNGKSNGWYILEDFEQETSQLPLDHDATPWSVVNSGAYAGTYAAKSGTITTANTTWKLPRILTWRNISFWYKVSSDRV
jgi:hypothetical protein